MDRVLRATSVAIIIFATVTAFVIGSRIDQNTISLLSGTMIGILVAAPCAAIITFVLVRRRDANSLSSYDRNMRQSTPMPQSPPQYWVMPQQYAQLNGAAYMQAGGAQGWPMPQQDAPYLPRQRRFYVIGENGDPRMLEDRSAMAGSGDPYEADSESPGAAF
jgi:hypothetical protein